jgi:hypothetical protein
MSAERDNLEPPESDFTGQSSQPKNQPVDRSADAKRPTADREVVRPAVEAKPADTAPDKQQAALFEPNALNQFNARWANVQTSFVDEPRRAVQEADALVSDVIKRIADTFGNERAALERQWDRGDSVSTEDLRLALQRYRSFFSRLLTL